MRRDVPLVQLDHRIYSCDDHLDLFNVPRALWEERLPSKYREAGPRVVEKGGRPLWSVGSRILGPSGEGSYPTALSRVDLPDAGFRPSQPKLRLEDMERDGIHASVVYGPAALFAFPISDPDHQKAVLAAWNDWAAEVFNAHAPDRLFALPFLPATSPEDAVAELTRCAARGHRGAILSPYEADVADPKWDPLWAAAAEAGLPISFHIGGGSRIRVHDGGWKIAAFAAVAPMQLDEPLSAMVFSGALERHPRLQLVLAESGVGWVPYFVARMDATFEKHCAPHPQYSIRTRPSELFHRQVYATFEEEPLGPQLIPLLGADRFMWACDFPHPDSTWPHSREAIAHALGGLPADAVRKVTGENCRALYRLP
jgi:predicted TIM-barrel fold metal-dependent hydrolase